MAAHEHLAEAQFHQREGRPNKHEHSADGDDEHSSAPGKPHVHITHPAYKKHPMHRRSGHGAHGAH